MPASAWVIWWPAIIWITSKSTGPYTVVKIHTPLYAVGRSIEDVQVHGKYGVTVVGLKAPGKEFQYGSKELVMHRNDELILMGKQDQIDHFIQG